MKRRRGIDSYVGGKPTVPFGAILVLPPPPWDFRGGNRRWRGTSHGLSGEEGLPSIAICLAEKELEKIAIATQRNRQRLTGKTAIAMRVGKLVGKKPGCKYFSWQIEENSFVYSKNEEKIAEENKLDGVYVIRTSVSAEEMSEREVLKGYKSLSKVEQAFRCCKSMDLKG